MPPIKEVVYCTVKQSTNQKIPGIFLGCSIAFPGVLFHSKVIGACPPATGYSMAINSWENNNSNNNNASNDTYNASNNNNNNNNAGSSNNNNNKPLQGTTVATYMDVSRETFTILINQRISNILSPCVYKYLTACQFGCKCKERLDIHINMSTIHTYSSRVVPCCKFQAQRAHTGADGANHKRPCPQTITSRKKGSR